MGPRLVSRGNPLHDVTNDKIFLALQWGRGLLAAEMRSGSIV